MEARSIEITAWVISLAASVVLIIRWPRSLPAFLYFLLEDLLRSSCLLCIWLWLPRAYTPFWRYTVPLDSLLLCSAGIEAWSRAAGRITSNVERLIIVSLVLAAGAWLVFEPSSSLRLTHRLLIARALVTVVVSTAIVATMSWRHSWDTHAAIMFLFCGFDVVTGTAIVYGAAKWAGGSFVMVGQCVCLVMWILWTLRYKRNPK